MTKNKLLEKIIHPNRVSIYGGMSSALGVGLLFDNSTNILGAGLVTLGYVCDYLDGKIAQEYSLRTLEGAKLDPLVDKAKNVLVGSYVILNEFFRGGIALPIAIAGNFIVDYISQRERGDILEQMEDSYRAIWDLESCHKDAEVDSSIRANRYGKAKTVIQAGVNLSYIGFEILNNHLSQVEMDYVAPTLAVALGVSAGLGIKGILKRRKNKLGD